MNFNQELPKDVEKKLNAYIKRIKNIHWFKPSDKLDKKSIDKQVKFCLEVFGVKAGIEYRWLKTPNDWGAALGAARDAAWGAADILVENLADYQKKYPQGNFKNLIQLWEMGLYPIGVIDGKFVVYIPPCKL